MLLAGDVGATSTRLALIEMRKGIPELVVTKTYLSQQHASLEECLMQMLQEYPALSLEAAVLAVPGPVINGCCHVTNLPWIVEEKALRTLLTPLWLLNDVEAHAWAIASDILFCHSLFAGENVPGTRALIAPGTGLGEASIVWTGQEYLPLASEGGHCDFAPRGEEQRALAHFLEKRWPHLSYERLLSGPGLCLLYTFCRDVLKKAVTQEPQGAAQITEWGLLGTDPSCEHALALFVQILGSEVGNCALKYLAYGGLYLGGGIPRKILSKLQSPLFIESYLDKGRMRSLLEKVSIKVIDEEWSAVRGAACYAVRKQHCKG